MQSALTTYPIYNGSLDIQLDENRGYALKAEAREAWQMNVSTKKPQGVNARSGW